LRSNLLLGVFLFLLLATSAALASDWASVGVDGEGNTWLVDKASVLKNGDVVTAWKWIQLKEPKPNSPDGSPISAILFLDMTDCVKWRVGVKASKLLRKDGSVIAASEYADVDIKWESMASGMTAEKAMIFVCSAPGGTPDRDGSSSQLPETAIAPVSGWMSVGLDHQGNNWLVDKDSIVRGKDDVRAWKRIEYTEPKPYPPNGALISSVLFLDVTDCAKRRVGVKASKLFRKDGALIAEHEDDDASIKWQSVAPDTLVEKAMRFVCTVEGETAK